MKGFDCTEGAICSQTLARDGTPKKSYFPKYHFSTVSQTLLRPVFHLKNTSFNLNYSIGYFWRLFERYTREDALTAKGFFFGHEFPFFGFFWGKFLTARGDDRLLVTNRGPTWTQKVRKKVVPDHHNTLISDSRTDFFGDRVTWAHFLTRAWKFYDPARFFDWTQFMCSKGTQLPIAKKCGFRVFMGIWPGPLKSQILIVNRSTPTKPFDMNMCCSRSLNSPCQNMVKTNICNGPESTCAVPRPKPFDTWIYVVLEVWIALVKTWSKRTLAMGRRALAQSRDPNPLTHEYVLFSKFE